MPKIYNALLSIRDSNFFTIPCVYVLLKNNFSAEEIVSYKFIENIPSIELSDGTILSSYENHYFLFAEKFGIPHTHMTCVLNYVLRFKYPHFRPDKVIDTHPIPRKFFPSIIHRQHLNTFDDIYVSDDSPQQLKEIFSIKNGDNILELGSFIGMGTVNLSRMTGNKGRIVSVEADGNAYFNLMLNLKNNGIQNVRTLNYAASDTDSERAVIYKDEFQKNSVVKNVVREQNKEYIHSRRLDTLCRENNMDPDFIIMTINGAEYQVLHSSRKFLEDLVNVRIIIPGWYKDNKGKIGPRIIELLRETGFRVSFTKGMHIFAYKE